MSDFLNENAEFVCTCGGKISCKDFDNIKVTYNGKTLLTTDAKKFFASGQCAIMTAQLKSPQPCMVHCNLGEWIPGFSPLKISGSKPILMDSAKNSCLIGGFISVKKSGVNGNLTTGSVPSTLSIAAAKILDVKISDEQNKNSATQKNSDKQGKKSVEFKNLAEKISEDKNSVTFKISDGENISVTKIKKTESYSNAKKIFDVNFRCNDCANKTCAYKTCSFRESSPVKKSSDDLRDNYYEYIRCLIGEKVSDRIESRNKDLEFCRNIYRKIFDSNCTDADKFFFQSLIKLHEILEKTNKLAWWYAAHHIVPGEEVFKNYSKCYRVANFIGADDLRIFDINESANCIMLLTSNQNTKYDTPFDTLKKKIHSSKILPQFIKSFTDVDNYELMDFAESQLKNKIQWHDTRHSYKFAGDEIESFGKKFPGKDLISYEKAVSKRIEIINDKIDLKNFCPMEIRKDILNLTENIRRHLLDFAKNPCASYPYYVTKKNYLYALLN